MLLTRGGGTQPKYHRDNLRTQYLHINKDNQNSNIWDTSYTKYLVDMEILDVQVEWTFPVSYGDLRVLIDFPSKMRPLQEYQPESRNTVVVFTEPVIGLPATNVTSKSFLDTLDRPQLEVKDPQEQVSMRNLILDVNPANVNSANSVDDWDILLKVKYVNESQ